MSLESPFEEFIKKDFDQKYGKLQKKQTKAGQRAQADDKAEELKNNAYLQYLQASRDAARQGEELLLKFYEILEDKDSKCRQEKAEQEETELLALLGKLEESLDPPKTVLEPKDFENIMWAMIKASVEKGHDFRKGSFQLHFAEEKQRNAFFLLLNKSSGMYARSSSHFRGKDPVSGKTRLPSTKALMAGIGSSAGADKDLGLKSNVFGSQRGIDLKNSTTAQIDSFPGAFSTVLISRVDQTRLGRKPEEHFSVLLKPETSPVDLKTVVNLFEAVSNNKKWRTKCYDAFYHGMKLFVKHTEGSVGNMDFRENELNPVKLQEFKSRLAHEHIEGLTWEQKQRLDKKLEELIAKDKPVKVSSLKALLMSELKASSLQSDETQSTGSTGTVGTLKSATVFFASKVLGPSRQLKASASEGLSFSSWFDNETAFGSALRIGYQRDENGKGTLSVSVGAPTESDSLSVSSGVSTKAPTESRSSIDTDGNLSSHSNAF